MKNVIEVLHQLTHTKIVFCYGAKSYHKYIRKHFKVDEYIEHGGVTTSWNNKKQFTIIVGVKKSKHKHMLMGLVIHELSHAVSHLMNEHCFDCDEFRSYTIQWLYHEIMPSLDVLILKDKK